MTTTQSLSQATSGRLNGKVALVTGASSGIGRATAKALAAAGAKLVLAARREDRLKAISDDIDRTGGEVLVLPVDLSDERATLELIDRASTHWGRLDISIDSAGIADAAAVEIELATHISDPSLHQGFLDSVASIEQLQPEDVAAAVVYAVTQPPRVSVNSTDF